MSGEPKRQREARPPRSRGEKSAPAAAATGSRNALSGRPGGAGRGRGIGAPRPGASGDVAAAATTASSGRGRGRRKEGPGKKEGRGRGRGNGSDHGSSKPRAGPPGLSIQAHASSKPDDRRMSTDLVVEDECIICTRPREFTAVGPCNHALCHVCALRIRTFNAQKKNDSGEGGWDCPVCREELSPLAIYEGGKASFDRQGLRFLPKDEKLHLYFDSERARDAVKEILSFQCTVCPPDAQEPLADEKSLRRHLSQVHALFHCDICAESEMLFPWERKLYSRKELVQHKRSKNSQGNFIHPRCNFCDKRFFSALELSVHMDREHEECHICRKAGRQNQFYINYKELENHFKKKHFVCTHPDCVEARFVVFETELQLEHHRLAVHEAGSRGARIEITRVFSGGRGRNNDRRAEEADVGSATTPPADLFDGPSLQAAAGKAESSLGNSSATASGGSWVGSTSTSSGSRSVGAAPISSVTDFPTLGDSASAQSRSGASWVGASSQPNRSRSQPSNNRSVPQPGDFPSLGGASGSSSGTKRPAILGKSRHRVIPNRGSAPASVPAPDWSSAPSVINSVPPLAESDGNSQPAPAPAPKKSVQKPITASDLADSSAFPSLGGGSHTRGSVIDGPQWASRGTRSSAKKSDATQSEIPTSGQFIEPTECRQRNRNLITEIKRVCTESQFDDFKAASSGLRGGDMGAADFFGLCVDVLGLRLSNVFPELVALLPNIAIQRDLLAVASNWDQARHGGDHTEAGSATLIVHPKSGQVIKVDDVEAHDRALDSMSFPSLASAAAPPKTNNQKDSAMSFAKSKKVSNKKKKSNSVVENGNNSTSAKSGRAADSDPQKSDGSRREYKKAQSHTFKAMSAPKWSAPSAQFDW